MSLIYARLNDLPPFERLVRMRHYLKVPLYLVKQFVRNPVRSPSTQFSRAKDEAELRMNLLHDWADHYPKG